jgi:hypothetical protein
MFADKIDIHNGNLNSNIPQKLTSLSATWFNTQHNKKYIKQLRNNLYNYFTNMLKAKSETILWTAFKKSKVKLQGKGYTSQFLACNCRSTNSYDDRTNLAYCINVFFHPAIKQYFEQYNIEIDEELYAVSEMLQWIWRSAIRKGESINIYIPSARMRALLKGWLNFNIFEKTIFKEVA